MVLTKEELRMIKDQECLRIKNSITAKVNELLSETWDSLKKIHKDEKLHFPDQNSITSGKISKGENYLGLPYQLLDYPAIFTSKNVFAFRTMFWWGNFFSVTLHLQGTSLKFYRDKIIENINLLDNQNIFIGIGETPWDYHYEPNNYEPLSKDHSIFMEKCKFIKLSKKIELEKWQELPSFSTDYFRQILSILNN